MARIQITGRAVVITSTLAMKAIELLSKTAPDALTIKDAEGKPIFGVAKGNSAGLSKNGVFFNDTSATGYARITLSIPESVAAKNVKKYVTDTYASALIALSAAENAINAKVLQVQADFEGVERTIEVMDPQPQTGDTVESDEE